MLWEIAAEIHQAFTLLFKLPGVCTDRKLLLRNAISFQFAIEHVLRVQSTFHYLFCYVFSAAIRQSCCQYPSKCYCCVFMTESLGEFLVKQNRELIKERRKIVSPSSPHIDFLLLVIENHWVCQTWQRSNLTSLSTANCPDKFHFPNVRLSRKTIAIVVPRWINCTALHHNSLGVLRLSSRSESGHLANKQQLK